MMPPLCRPCLRHSLETPATHQLRWPDGQLWYFCQRHADAVKASIFLQPTPIHSPTPTRSS